MISNKVIERLKKKNWFVTSQNKQEASLVLQACDDAGITWADGEKATEWFPFEKYLLYIGFFNDENGITRSHYNLYEKCELENITDWFFNAIKNNDGNLTPKLTPQNAEKEHLVQILLAMMQNIPVECDFDDGDGWVDAAILYIDLDKKYRIKPTSTPLPIPRELWSYIDKRWRFIVMDENKEIYLYEERPFTNGKGWSPCFDDYSECPLNINTDGINWETSLTERPEDI